MSIRQLPVLLLQDPTNTATSRIAVLAGLGTAAGTRPATHTHVIPADVLERIHISPNLHGDLTTNILAMSALEGATTRGLVGRSLTHTVLAGGTLIQTTGDVAVVGDVTETVETVGTHDLHFRLGAA